MATSSAKGTLQKHARPTDRIDQLLSLNGDGTGGTNLGVDGSGGAVKEFTYRPAIDPVFGGAIVAELERMNVIIRTASRITPALYGDVDLSSGIGLKIAIKDADGEVIHNFTPNSLTVTQHWGLVAGSDVSPSAFQAGADAVNIRWTFTKGGDPLVLDGAKGEYLSILVSDDLSGLTEHTCQIQGKRHYY